MSELSVKCPECHGTSLFRLEEHRYGPDRWWCKTCDKYARICLLCLCAIANSRHHLHPRNVQLERHQFSRPVAHVCAVCHRMVHAVLTNKEMAKSYRSIEALRAHPMIQQFVQWRNSHPGSAPSISRSNDRTSHSKYS